MSFPLSGLIAAVCTPMHGDGSLNLDVIPRAVSQLVSDGVTGIYICGSTGEGISLTCSERKSVAEAFITAARARLKTIVQVGHNSVSEARDLARHAQAVGADAISSVPPSYFKMGSVDVLVRCMADIAAGAPDRPFYYYHIPTLSGHSYDMPSFLEISANRIPNLAGIKFTSQAAFEYQACRNVMDGRFDIVWGVDEMLLSALVVGARAAIGSTYNVAGRLYRALIDAFERGDLHSARVLQLQSVNLVRLMNRYPFHAALKYLWTLKGIDYGSCRAPLESLSPAAQAKLCSEIHALGVADWLRCATSGHCESPESVQQLDGQQIDGLPHVRQA